MKHSKKSLITILFCVIVLSLTGLLWGLDTKGGFKLDRKDDTCAYPVYTYTYDSQPNIKYFRFTLSPYLMYGWSTSKAFNGGDSAGEGSNAEILSAIKDIKEKIPWFIKIDDIRAKPQILEIYTYINVDSIQKITVRLKSYTQSDLQKFIPFNLFTEWLKPVHLNSFNDRFDRNCDRVFRFSDQTQIEMARGFIDSYNSSAKDLTDKIKTDGLSYVVVKKDDKQFPYPHFSSYLLTDPGSKIAPDIEKIPGVHEKYFTKKRNTSGNIVEEEMVNFLHKKPQDHKLGKTLTSREIHDWSGRDRKPLTQDEVMNNCSANEIAFALGLERHIAPNSTPVTNNNSCDNFGYEWLHLVAHSLGPAAGLNNNPQHKKNLVIGTKAANTLMINHEQIVKILALNGFDVTLTVKAIPFEKTIGGEYPLWIVKDIEYIYEVKGHPELSNVVHIDPFLKTTPSLAEKIFCDRFITFGNDIQSVEGSMVDDTARRKHYVCFSEKLRTMPVKSRSSGVYTVKHTVGNSPDMFPYGSAKPAGFPHLYDNLPYTNINYNNYYHIDETSLISRYLNLSSASVSNPVSGNIYTASARIPDSHLPAFNQFLCSEVTSPPVFEYKTDNFMLSDLFQDFDCEFLDQFVFDNVSIGIEREEGISGTDNIIVFEGTLVMNKGILEAFGDFMHVQDGLIMRARINAGTDDQILAGKIDPKSIVIESAMKFNLPVTSGITLTEAGLQLIIMEKLDYINMKRGWYIKPSIHGSIEFSDLGTAEPVVLDCLLSYDNGTLHADAFCDGAYGLFGIERIYLDSLQIQFDLGNTNNIEIAAYLSTGTKMYGLGGKLSSSGAGLFVKAEEFTINDLGELFYTTTGRSLTIPDFDIQFNDVLIGIATDSCSIGDVYLEKGLTLSGTVTAHGYTGSGTTVISGSMISFTGAMDEFDFGPVHISDAYASMYLYSGTRAEFSVGGSASIQGIDLACEVKFEKYEGVWNCVLYGKIEGEDLRFSSVFPVAEGTFMDSLSFSKAAFIVALRDCATQHPDYAFTVRKGLQLMAVLEEIPILSQLTGNTQTGLELCAYFGTGIDITVALPDTRLALGDFIETDPFKIRVSLAPPSFSLIFGMNVAMMNQTEPLHFDVVLDLGLLEAKGSGTMKGYWENPFGIQGLRIGPELALEIGINYAQFATTLTPSTFGIMGGMAVGDVEAQMALRLSSTSAQQILMGKLTKLSPHDLIAFTNTITGSNIPSDQIPDFIEFNDLNIYIAPLGGSIGTVIFERGISFSGEMICFGKRASINARLSDNGFVAKGHIDQIDFGPLKIHGKQGENAELDIELTQARQSIFIDGEIEFFNCSVGVFAKASVNGIEFEFDQTILDILRLSLHGKSEGSLDDLASLGFTLSGELVLAGNRVAVNGLLRANGTFSLEGDARINLAGIDLADAHLAFSNSGIALSGNINIGGSYFRVSGDIASNGSFKLAGAGNITIGGFSLANAQFTFDNSGITVSGKVNIGGSMVQVSGSVNASGAFSFNGTGNISLLGYSIAGAKIAFSNSGISGSGALSFAGFTFSVSFSASTDGKVNGSGSVNVGPFYLGAFGVEVGSFSGTVTLSISNNAVRASFAGRSCIMGACSNLSGSVGTDGVLTFTAQVCLYLPVAGISCSRQCTNVCLPECYWGSSCSQICVPFLGCSTVCVPVLLCPIKCHKVCIDVCVPVINMVYTCSNVTFSIDLF
ncbi:MAG: hypothetical protein JW881_03005 [Spirochaetales bacterium]|nr:hypothetical protein [Spirochaetales bacterium]